GAPGAVGPPARHRGARSVIPRRGVAVRDPVAGAPVPGPVAEAPSRLSRRGRAVRAAVTAAAGLALLAGSLWGTNDHFPFGPFSMSATARRTDGFVRQTRVEAIDAGGRRCTVGDASTGLRRAEIEGQIAGFRD